MARADLAQSQRVAERQRMRHPRLVALRRDHGDVVGEFAGDRFEDCQALRVDAVVIGEQDSHGCLFGPLYAGGEGGAKDRRFMRRGDCAARHDRLAGRGWRERGVPGLAAVLFDMNDVLCRYDRSAASQSLRTRGRPPAFVEAAIWGSDEDRGDEGAFGADDFRRFRRTPGLPAFARRMDSSAKSRSHADARRTALASEVSARFGSLC